MFLSSNTIVFDLTVFTTSPAFSMAIPVASVSDQYSRFFLFNIYAFERMLSAIIRCLFSLLSYLIYIYASFIIIVCAVTLHSFFIFKEFRFCTFKRCRMIKKYIKYQAVSLLNVYTQGIDFFK